MAKDLVVKLSNPTDSPEKIADKLNTLVYAIDASVIRGVATRDELEKIQGLLEKYIKGERERTDFNDQRWHGGGINTVTHDATLGGLGTPASPLSVVGGGLTVYNDTVSGTINGSNKVFTVPHTITSAYTLFLANSVYQSGVDYTFSGTTITFTLAPDSSLSGQPFFLVHN